MRAVAERVWLYAVVSGASGPLRAEGAAGERLRRVRVGGLDLVVGIVPRVPRPTAAALRRYDAAVRRLMDAHGSVLPARYATSAPSLDALASAALDRRDTLRRSLGLVRQRVQMTVRVFTPRGPEGRAKAAVARGGQPSRAASGPGRQFLSRRAAELQVPGGEPLRAAVARWVRAERTERHDRGPLAGSMYHLIPRGCAGAYRTAVERAAVRAGLTIVVSGPWPPYAFADAAW
jgi:hypothetical protein